ncbi:MAG: TIGR03067 domain-containing protein [Pirellulaceae bacterium]|nr:TIGR03067 domain-containing protein [Pirellulaceae bacterium]
MITRFNLATILSCGLFGSIVFLSSLCCLAAEEDLASHQHEIQGTWVAHIDGDTTGEMVLDNGTLTYTWIHGGDKKQLIWAGSYTLDPTTSPKQMTWLAKNPDKPNAPRNNAIYQLHGDLLLVIGRNRGQRPMHFYCGPRSEPSTVIFHRRNETANVALPSN